MHACEVSIGRTHSRLMALALGVASAAAFVVALVLGFARPHLALADEVDDDVAATATRVEQASEEYAAATEHVAEVQQQIAENEQRIAEIEAELPAQRERSADSIRTLYKLQRSTGGLLDLVLSSESFSSLLSTLQYLNIINERNTVEVAHLVELSEELAIAQTSLEAQRQEAMTAQAEAEAALFDAQAARTEAQQRVAARAAAEAAEAEAARKAAEEAAAKEETFTTASGNTAEVTVDDKPAGTAEVRYEGEEKEEESSSDDSSDDSQESSEEGGSSTSGSVEEWASRIDAYLSGSPLAGYGYAFAQAALNYGVDPRWSPAISCIESSKGAHCFRSHNAWGWGNSGWDSWEEAIDAHVRGLANGYGYSITVWAAQKYCPPNWSYWYSAVSSEMNRI